MPSARWKKRILQIRHSEGLHGVLRFVGTRLLRLYRHRVFVCNLDKLSREPVDPAQPGAPEAMFLTTEEDLRKGHSHLQGLPLQLEEYWDGIRTGNTRGLLLLIDDTPAHWAFVMRESRTATLLGFERGAALLGNDFTVPKYRHLGLHTRSVRLRLQEARKWGTAYAIAETAMDNDFSARALTRGGMSELGSVTLCVVLNHFVIRVGHDGYHPKPFGYSV